MTVVALYKKPSSSDVDIDAAITNLYRCCTYPTVKAAIHEVALQMQAVTPPINESEA